MRTLKLPFFLVTLSWYCLPASSQTNLRFMDETVRGVQGLWSVQVQQFNSSAQSVYVMATVREKNAGDIYKAKSGVFSLPPGVTLLNNSTVQPLEVLLDRLPSNDELPNGQYWFQVVLYDAESNREIVTILTKTEITGATVLSGFGTNTSKKNYFFESTGRIRTAFYLNHPSLENSRIPPQYNRTDLQARVTLFHLPLEVNGLYSSEKKNVFGPPNQFGISLDKEAVKAAALQLLTEKMSPSQLFDSTEVAKATYYREMLRDKRYPQYQGWKEKYDSLHLEDNLRAKQQLTGLESILENKALTRQMDELQSVKNRYDIQSPEDLAALAGQIPDSVYQRYNSLFRLEQSYKRMEQQRDALKNKAERFDKYEGLYKKVKAVERQQNISDLAKDADDVRDGLKNFGRINRLQAVLLGIDEFEIGSCYPYFSSLTLNGVRLRGANISYTTPQKWHIAITGGRKQRNFEIDTNFLYQNKSFYSQNLIGLQFGIGRPNGNFIYVQHVRAADYGALPATLIGHPEFQTTREEGFVTGAAFQFKDKQQIILLSGEINQSLVNPDLSSNILDGSNRQNLARFLGANAKAGSALDISYQGAIKVYLPNGTTRFSGLLHRVGAGYESFGVPYMMRDINRYEIKANQELFKKEIQIGGYMRRDYDQISPLAKLNRTFTTAFGAQLRATPNKSIVFNVDFAPYAQQQSGVRQGAAISRKGNILVSSIQWRNKIQNFNFATQGSWIFQNFRNSDTAGVSKIHSIQSSTQFIHPKYIFSVVGQYSPRITQQQKATTLYSIDVSVSLLRVFKKVGFTFGGQHVRETGITSLDAMYFRTNMQINRQFSLDLNFREAVIKRLVSKQSLIQEYGWLAINMRW
jgi:hypothetical protein